MTRLVTLGHTGCGEKISMKDLNSLGLRYSGGLLQVLDQQKLPNQEEWITCRHPGDMIECIRHLKVRGAPLIGVAAALSLAQLAESGASEAQFLRAAAELRDSRPTAVNLMAAIDRMTELGLRGYHQEVIVQMAELIFDEDVELCSQMAKNGMAVISDGDSVLTHCNTGGLATVGVGTALGVIRAAFESGKRIHVYVDETRPLLQGGRLTTWELDQLGIPYTLICDNMAASLMAAGKIQKAIVGSDRIAANGDFANKVGTYGVAVLCHHHQIPFYVAAPYTTVDAHCPTGREIPIEERSAAEVRGVMGSFGAVQWAPGECEVFNPSFDVTPAQLVTGWILDCGLYGQREIKSGILRRLGK